MPIIIENLNFVYNPRTTFEKHAVKNVSLTINDGDYLAIIGPTGSGKSTFIQHLNGLIRVQKNSGSIFVDDMNITPKKIDFNKLRSQVGMVFQYPEYQLFADTVYNDVAFGLKNIKLNKEEIEPRVREALTLVGLDFDEVSGKSPFELSGGEKRRVAIAGVVAMQPKILVLDEPIAGLDPQGKREILELLLKLKATCSPTIVIISHDMDEVARYATRVAVFNEGEIIYDLPPQELFEKVDELRAIGLDIPQLARLREILSKKGLFVSPSCLSVSKMADGIIGLKKGGNNV